MLWGNLGTQLLFSTAYHPQTDGQTKVTNRTLGAFLHTVLKANPRKWEDLLCHVEFANNMSYHFATRRKPFEVVYGTNTKAPMQISPKPWSKEDHVNVVNRVE